METTRKTEPPAPPESSASDSRSPRRNAVSKRNLGLDNVPLTLKAQLVSWRLPRKTLANMKLGDVLDLPPESLERIELRVGKVAKFKGRLGIREGKRAIQINAVCKL
jgi:flagellar motor switch protein FliM